MPARYFTDDNNDDGDKTVPVSGVGQGETQINASNDCFWSLGI